MLTALSYATSVWVVLTYFMMVRGRWSQFRFDLANAIGFVPVAALNIMAGVYPPLVLTLSFGFIGLYGTIKELWQRHGPERLYEDPAWSMLVSYADLEYRTAPRKARFTEENQ